jgi:hypothetical protein
MGSARTHEMNHALTPQQMWAKIHQAPVFANLTHEEFSSMMSLLKIIKVENGALLLKQHGDDGNLYVIRRGRALARFARPGGEDEIASEYKPGDLINTASFLTGKLNDLAVVALDDLELWVIPGVDFRALKIDVETIEEKLQYPQEALDYINQTRVFEDQRPGERILWRSKKHFWVFLESGSIAWVLFVGLAITLIVSARVALLSVFLSSIPGTILWVGALIAAVGLALWHFVDWQNDYYVVTDQRVVHRERIFLFYDQQDECPIAKVQNVNVRRSSWVTSVFDVGDVLIETQGVRSNVEFTWVGKPDDAAKYILAQANTARMVQHSSERERIRSTIRKEMNLGGHYEASSKQTYQPQKQQQSAAARRRAGIGAALKRARYRLIPPMRSQEGKDIVYHKHWLQLAVTAGPPFGAVLAYSAALLAIFLFSPELAALAFRSFFVIPIGALGLIALGWLLWRYEDWRNDYYTLKPDRVIDHDRTPFNLRGSQQKTAGMSNIQNVSYETRGFLDSVFNVGDVVLQTGGTDGKLVFERVWNPRRVHRDIVDRLESFQTMQREAQAEAQRREMAEWLGIYDDLARRHERKKTR